MPGSRHGSKRFHDWLLGTQIEPTFAQHRFLQRALVLGIPQLWRPPEPGASVDPIRLMIVYSQDARVRLDSLVPAYTHGTQDPNLPEGVGNHDLFAPVGSIPGSRAPMPVAFCEPGVFVGGEADVENDDGGVFDAFFVYATFERAAEGVVCTRCDERMGERLSRYLDALAGGP